MFGRLEGAAGGTDGASPFMVGGGAGYAIGIAGGTNASFVGGRLGIGLSGAALIRSDEPPTMAFGAGVRPAASDVVPGLRFNGPNGDVMLFVEGTIGWIGGGGRASTDGASFTPGDMLAKRESPPIRCISGAPLSDGRLAGGGGGAGAPFSRCRWS